MEDAEDAEPTRALLPAPALELTPPPLPLAVDRPSGGIRAKTDELERRRVELDRLTERMAGLKQEHETMSRASASFGPSADA
jgi:hypothetical protein